MGTRGTRLTDRPVTWGTSDAAVATVSATGVVQARGVGRAQITATAEGKTGAAVVRVVAPPPAPVARVEVTPPAATLTLASLGGPTPTVPLTTQLTARTFNDAGAELTGRTVTWSTRSAAVADVSPSGLVTARGLGTTDIVATSEGKTAAATITVIDPVARVTVTPTPVTLRSGQTQTFTAAAFDAANFALVGRTFTWSVDNAALSIPAGVTGSQITATAGTRASAVTVTLTASTGAAPVRGPAQVTVQPPAAPTTTSLPVSGFSSIVRTAAGAAQPIANSIEVGDIEGRGDGTVQAFITYPLTGLTATSTIQSAALTLGQDPVDVDGNPFALGPLYAERVTGASPALNEGALQADATRVASALATQFSVDVAPLVRQALAAGQTTLTIRLRFQQLRNNNGITDRLDMTVSPLTVSYVP